MRRRRRWSNAVRRSTNRPLLPRKLLSPGVMCRLSSGSPEADSSLVGQGGDPFGPQHPREGAKHAWQTPGRHDGHALGDHLAPGDLGPVDSHDRHHHLGSARTWAARSASNDTARRTTVRGERPCHGRPEGRAGGGRDSAWSRRRTPRRGRSPSGPGWPGCRGRPGHAGPHSPAAPGGRAAEQYAAPPPPRAARRRRRGWARTAAPSRPPGPRHANHQAEPGHQQAAKCPHRPRCWGGGRPPGQRRGPGGPLGRPQAPPLRLGRPPGWPTLARTRMATTGRSAPVPASSWSGSSSRWARMACRSAWLSGRTDPLGRSSSSKGQGRGLAIGGSFLVVLDIPRLVGVKRRLAGCGATRPCVRRSWCGGGGSRAGCRPAGWPAPAGPGGGSRRGRAAGRSRPGRRVSGSGR